jgi:hypothetical protein
MAWNVPAFIPGLPVDAARVIQQALQGIYNELSRQGQNRNLIPLVEDIYARPGSVIAGVGNGQTVTLLPPGASGYTDPVTLLLTDVEDPVTVVHPDGTTDTITAPGAYEYLPASPTEYETSPGGIVIGGAMSANSVLGNPTAAAAAPTEIPVADISVLGRAGLAGTGNLESITVPSTATATGETMFLKGNSGRTALRFINFTLGDLPLISDNRFIGNISGATGRPIYTDIGDLGSDSVLYENTGKTFVREALTGAITAAQNSNATLFDTNASGAGLTGGGTAVLAVGAGTHITVNANDVAVNLTTLAAAIDSASVVANGSVLERAAISGDITMAQNSNTAAITAGVIVDADVNASAAIAQTKLGATTGFSVKASGSAATTSAEPIVTFSASANMSNERVLSNGTGTTVDIGTAGQIQIDVDTPLIDGDKGDITVSSNGAVFTIDSGVVTLAKMANLAEATVIGRASGAGTGVPTALTGAQVGQITRFSSQEDSATATGTYEPTLADNTTIYRVNPAAGDTITFTGFAFASGNAGKVFLLIKQGGDGTCVVQHNVGATAANGAFTPHEQDFILTGANTCAILWYQTSSSRWNITGAKVADRDYGDITVSAGGQTWTIDSGAVTLAKLANQADDTFLANISGGAAPPTAVALTTLAGAGLTGGADAILAVGAGTGITVNANDVAVDLATLVPAIDSASVVANGTVLERAALTGAITAAQNSNATLFGSGASGAGLTGGGTAILAVGAGTYITVNADDVAVNRAALSADLDSTSVVDSSGTLQRAALTGDVTASQNSNATTIAANAVTTAKILDANVTLAKMANIAAGTVIGRQVDAGTGVPVALTGSEQGENIRQGLREDMNLAPGTFDDVAVDARTKVIRINPTSNADVIITGFALGSSNTDAYFRLLIIGGDGRVVLKNENAGSLAANRILTPNSADYILTKDRDGCELQYVAGRWTPIERAFLVRKNSTGTDFARQRLNLIEGSGITLTVADDSTNAEVDVTVTATATGLTDGDKGDVTVSAAGATWTIDNGAVSLAKQANLAQSRIIGRSEGAGTGVPEALTPTQVIAIVDGESPTWTGQHSFTGASHSVVTTGDTAISGDGGMWLGSGHTPVGVTSGDVVINASSGIAINADTTTPVTSVSDGNVAVTGIVLSANMTGDITLSSGNDITLAASSQVQVTSPFLVASQFRLNGIITPTVSADQNNWNPAGLSGANVVRINATAPATITGIAAQTDGTVLVLVNVGTSTVVIADESGSSTAANRIIHLFDAPNIVAGATWTLWYDGTSNRWRVQSIVGQINP